MYHKVLQFFESKRGFLFLKILSMPKSKYTIQRVEEPDLEFLGNFLYTCKLALPINRLLFKNWPNEGAQKPIYAGSIKGGFEDPSLEDFKAVDETGAIVGYLALSRKEPTVEKEGRAEEEVKRDEKESQGKERKEQELEGPFVSEVFKAVMEGVAEINEETEWFDHYEVTYIAVSPFHRRKGIGSKLLEVAVEKSKAEGLPLVLCTEPEAHDFALSQGFKEKNHFDIDLSQWASPMSGFGIFRLSGMIWTP